MTATHDTSTRFFEAVNAKDADALRGLLAETTRHEAAGTSFGSELLGGDAIAQYFADDVFPKFRDLRFTIVGAYCDGDVEIAEWAGDFVTVGGKAYQTKGVMIFLIKDDLVTSIREYFDTEKTRQAFA